MGLEKPLGSPGHSWGAQPRPGGLGQVHGSAALRCGCLAQDEGGGDEQRVPPREQAGHWESRAQGGGGRARGPTGAGEGGAPGEGHAMSLRAA